MTRINRGRLVKRLKAFQILMLIEHYNTLHELPDCTSELEDITNLLDNLTGEQVEILMMIYKKYPNHYALRNYLKNEKKDCFSDSSCASTSYDTTLDLEQETGAQAALYGDAQMQARRIRRCIDNTI